MKRKSAACPELGVAQGCSLTSAHSGRVVFLGARFNVSNAHISAISRNEEKTKSESLGRDGGELSKVRCAAAAT